ncbi:hypothetical protein OBBRIDRAFT_887811 [Obba rivulosa]|uniref:Uncharacterized protein n=1 Tax=Obba rivulosa TaxID=1052685 RepID=A0A8E2AXY9_9APHY|nr:hypothetical protein OBBRIDRAFT_887811 [Obba rivulosa]
MSGSSDSVVSTPIWDYLCSSLPAYKYTALDPRPRVGHATTQSTKKWLQKGKIEGLTIARQQWNWTSEDQFLEFEKCLKELSWGDLKHKDELNSGRQLTFRYPITEGDVAVAVETRIVQPVWYIMNSLIEGRGPRSHTKAKDMHFTSYVYNESYGKLNRVRVDKIFVYAFDPVRYKEVQELHIRTRSRALMDNAAEPVNEKKVALSYLPWSTLWGYIAPGSNLTNDMEKFKGLVPVEIKNLGIITLENFNALIPANPAETYDLGLEATSNSDLTGPELLAGILQQTIKYVDEYGCRCGFLTDSMNSVMIRIPCTAEGELELQGGRLQWAFISNEDKPRLALAFLLYLAKIEVDSMFERHERDFHEARTRDMEMVMARMNLRSTR